MTFLLKSTFISERLKMVGFPVLLFLLFVASTGHSQPREIHIKAVGGLQFDKVRIKAQPGEQLRIILTNADDMDHNMLFTKPGRREAVVEAATNMTDQGPELQFVPNTPDVLWASSVIGPGEADTLEFSVPQSEGIYPYVCTYPGHGIVMYGAMYVTTGDLPELARDEHIPPHRRGGSLGSDADIAHDHDQPKFKWHPYELIPPYWYRIFMPESGPASIAVNLDDSIFYCWDAGLCRLRYIWVDEFLDISQPWSIKGDASAKVLGEVVYREQDFPLDFGQEGLEVQYKGFKLIEGGFPEFYYTVGGIDVYELIRPVSSGQGIVRRFRIGEQARDFKFHSTSDGGVTFTSNRGSWNGTELHINEHGPIEIEIEMTWDEIKN